MKYVNCTIMGYALLSLVKRQQLEAKVPNVQVDLNFEAKVPEGNMNHHAHYNWKYKVHEIQVGHQLIIRSMMMHKYTFQINS